MGCLEFYVLFNSISDAMDYFIQAMLYTQQNRTNSADPGWAALFEPPGLLLHVYRFNYPEGNF